jgi:hypothetical protein
MPWGGLEPPCQLRHNALNVACLPISPPRLNFPSPVGDVYNHTGMPLLCQVLFLASTKFVLADSIFLFAKE